MGFTKVKFMPYMNFYLDNINKNENEVHILYWNRDLQSEDLTKYENCTFHEFACYQEDDVSKFAKIVPFAKYRKFAKKVINSENFDFIFVLHSIPGVLVADILKKRYKNKYVLDYRDYTYESLPPFKNIVAEITENSYATFVSSDAFRKFLPQNCEEKIYTSHNILKESLEHREDKELYGEKSDKIRVVSWGFIRYEEVNSEIIKKLANDQRFELHYYGREQQIAANLKALTSEIGAKNIFFHGEYQPEDRYDFVRKTDILHNIYYDNNAMFAISNKYYDGIIFKIPQICMQGAFMATKAEEGKVGMAANPFEDDFAEKLYSYYTSTEKQEFYENCDRELERVIKEYDKGIEVIQSISK